MVFAIPFSGRGIGELIGAGRSAAADRARDFEFLGIRELGQVGDARQTIPVQATDGAGVAKIICVDETLTDVSYKGQIINDFKVSCSRQSLTAYK
jgi:hypothetical protein